MGASANVRCRKTPLPQAVFSNDEAANALARTFNYKCAASFFWINFSSNVVKNVPINRGAVYNLSRQCFGLPWPHIYPFDVMVAVPTADYSIEGHVGGLQRISPEEPEHAMILRMKDPCKSRRKGRWGSLVSLRAPSTNPAE